MVLDAPCDENDRSLSILSFKNDSFIDLNQETGISRTAKIFHRMDEIFRRLKFSVGYNGRNLVKLATKILTENNYNRRKF